MRQTPLSNGPCKSPDRRPPLELIGSATHRLRCLMAQHAITALDAVWKIDSPNLVLGRVFVQPPQTSRQNSLAPRYPTTSLGCVRSTTANRLISRLSIFAAASGRSSSGCVTTTSRSPCPLRSTCRRYLFQTYGLGAAGLVELHGLSAMDTGDRSGVCGSDRDGCAGHGRALCY